MPVPIQLSQVRPDFADLVLQLQIFLNSRATWKDLLASSTGQTLMEMMAAVGTFNQFAVENAARESFLTTAVRDSSIYAITRMLGVRITRKNPASTTVTLTRLDPTYPQLIQELTQFTVNGVPFFNRDAITFRSGELSIPFVLYEGTVKTQLLAATSTSFYELSLNEPAFVVSDNVKDSRITVIRSDTGVRTLWSRIDQGIWTALATDNVYYDSTLGTGDTVLSFGDGWHGALAGLGNNIEVKYVVTVGAVGNNGGVGLKVACAEYVFLTGVNTSIVSGGSDEKPSSYYKLLAPAMYKARSRAVTPLDYKAIVSSYGGVACATIQAQKDIPQAVNDLRWMNVIRVCILPQAVAQDTFTPVQWQDFLKWFANFHHAAIHIQTYDPYKEIVHVDVELRLNQTASAEVVVAQVQARIDALFVRDITTLGRRISMSDIIDACAVPLVDYTLVNELRKDIDPVGTRNDVVPIDNLSYLAPAPNGVLVHASYSERTLYNEAARRII